MRRKMALLGIGLPLILAICLLFAHGAVFAQENATADGRQTLPDGRQVFTLQGPDLPRYYSVRHFFVFCLDALAFEGSHLLDEEAFYFNIPFKMGIAADSRAVNVIMQAQKRCHALHKPFVFNGLR